MNKETFEKFYSKFKKEQEGILMELAKLPKSSLNISGIIKLGLEKALRLPELWASGIIRQKEMLQNLVFPEGILYNRETDGVRTLKVSE